MLKLHVFLVDTGTMFTFDMEMALESVGKLMEAVFLLTQIPVGKQVLMIANGEPLNPTSRVASYKSAGTETNPIFLFSKSAIESPQPPISPSPVVSELSLEQQVEKCLQLPPSIETLVARASLASEFHLSARELGQTCEKFIANQQLQQQGWQAVVSNLENITRALNKHAKVFQDQYHKFLSTREQYLDMLDKFDDVISLLSRIPVLSCLTKSSAIFASKELCLLDWINSKEQNTSLETLVGQCKEILYQFDTQILETLMNEAHKVLECSENKGMKEIKGLDDRLSSLQQRLLVAQQLVQEQADMAQGFKQNQKRAEYIGDASVLPDLCISHRKQLIVMAKNQRQLRDICTLCTRAKDELSTNLHARLRWVMFVEHSICNYDSKLLVFHESLRKMNRRLEVLEQVFEAPRMYVLAVLEILRRKSFSAQFLEWGRNVSLSSSGTRSEEIEKRDNFAKVFGNHFLHSLFSGLEDIPSQFAESPPSIFDEMLPDIDVNDIRLLQSKVPELLVELSLGDSLEESLCVRERLSQTNLTKLCDPNSNPKLVETLRLRELTGNHGISKMTVSQLHKEISQEDMPIDIAQKQIDWKLDDIGMEIPVGDFEPSSLKTLPSELEGLQSSQSSEISDSLFRSAEGLDDGASEYPEETVGVLELSEVTERHVPERQVLERQTKEYLIEEASTKIPKEDWLYRSQEFVDGTHDREDDKNVRDKTEQSVDCPVMDDDRSAVHMDCIHVLDGAREIFMLLENIKSTAPTRELEIAIAKLLSIVSYKLEQSREKMETSDYLFPHEKQCCRNDVKILGELVGKGKSIAELKDEHSQSRRRQEEIREEEKKVLIAHIEKEYEKTIEQLKMDLDEAKEQSKTLNHQRDLEMNKIEDMTKEWKKKEEDFRETIESLIKDKIDFEEDTTKALEKAQTLNLSLGHENAKALELAVNIAKEEHEKTLTAAMNAEKEEHEKALNVALNAAKDKHENALRAALNAAKEEHEKNLQLSIGTAKEEHEKALNLALNAAKEEHESLLKVLKEEIEMQKSEMIQKDEQLKTLEDENLWYKSANKEISSKYKDLELRNDELNKQFLERKSYFEETVRKCQLERDRENKEWSRILEEERGNFERQIEIEMEKCDKMCNVKLIDLKNEFEKEKSALFENFEKEKTFLKEKSCSETLKLVEDFKRQRNTLKEDAEKEKLELKAELEKEKSSIILSCEVEKQKFAEEFEKQQSLSKTSSIEEGIDALEWEKLLQKLKDLEAENQKLKDEQNTKGESDPDDELLQLRKNKLQVFLLHSPDSDKQEKICFRQFKVDDLVILCYDEQRSNYVVLTTEDTKYFLHPDSKSLLKLTTDDPSQLREWLLAYITDQDYCVAKKVQNRFKLPVGTYFYRIHARPWQT
ncbi:RB1-inducible coiled-coil protein 1-like isoform X2 [Rhopilema esculentum]|uniref:RB1-inducible coiled-coil protein 1-like isoform X2 n=1 Tax=Rhopilema esculentum TaxID=499914 RepID=UPI0031D453A0